MGKTIKNFKIAEMNTWKALVAILLSLFLMLPAVSHAAETLCATVKIEIKQDVTLERQAFDAHMQINNGIESMNLEDVSVEILFTDADGDSVKATSNPNADPDAANNPYHFFVRGDTDGLIDASTSTSLIWTADPIPGSTSVDLNWLIIPVPNGLTTDTLYFVGAKLSYTLGGEAHETVVVPDFIKVKPLPQLQLDYFLPGDVYGADPLKSTPQNPDPENEPVVPFSLGVRVTNNGEGTAHSLKINSAQPKIVENKLGLLVDFTIEGSTVNGSPASDSLLVDFGDVGPGNSAVARWIMTCSLSGTFTEFDAYLTHSDELGGSLTSLIKQEDLNTFHLIRDVYVDKLGEDDHVRDFLATQDFTSDVPRVYQSSGGPDKEVFFKEETTAISSSSFDLTVVADDNINDSNSDNNDFIYYKVPLSDSGFEDQAVSSVIRNSDNKKIKAENAWISKNRNDDGDAWEYYFNLFDESSSADVTYSIAFTTASNGPEFDPGNITEQSVVEGDNLTFNFATITPPVPTLTTGLLPPGASFDNDADGDGTGTFTWNTQIGQAGSYYVWFKASDGVYEKSQKVTIQVFSDYDRDGDGMDDDWEGNNLPGCTVGSPCAHDGTGDADSDGISDLDEFIYDMDPNLPDTVPGTPVIESPANGTAMTVTLVDLVVTNTGVTAYAYEVYSDEGYSELVASSVVTEAADPGPTTYTVNLSTEADNANYYWRVRSVVTNGTYNNYSLWAYGDFNLNTANDAPGDFYLSYPADNKNVDSAVVTFEVTNSKDPDGDVLTYDFVVYDNTTPTPVVIETVTGVAEDPDGTTSQSIDLSTYGDGTYHWEVTATDGTLSSTTSQGTFHVVTPGNNAPTVPVAESPDAGIDVADPDVEIIVTNATDADEDEIEYYFELDTVNTFDSQGSGNPLMAPAADDVNISIDTEMDLTRWFISDLSDNTEYFWRVKACDGSAQSEWVYGSFIVNTINDNPDTPTEHNPGDAAWVDSFTPELSVNPVQDADNDSVDYYTFEIYEDQALEFLMGAETSPELSWTIPFRLENHTRYFWRARSVDEHGAASEWMDTADFFVMDDGVDEAPTISIVSLDPSGATPADTFVRIEWNDSDPDSNAVVSLYYDTDDTGSDGTMIKGNIAEGPDGSDDVYTWDITAMYWDEDEEQLVYDVDEGVYYIYAVIQDDSTSAVAYSTETVEIERPFIVYADPEGGTVAEPYDLLMPTYVNLYTDDVSSTIYYILDGTSPLDGAAPSATAIEYVEKIYIAGDPDTPLDPVTVLKFAAIDSSIPANATAVVEAVFRIIDTDEDGLADAWEENYFGDTTTSNGGTDDTDTDGLTDTAEYLIRTDPSDSDTDNDGLLDGQEVDCSTDPHVGDTDEDGINDGDEKAYWDTDWNTDYDGDAATYPNNLLDPDSDNDGLGDGDEINVYGTDPALVDTDNDGIDDDAELKYWGDNWNMNYDGDGTANNLLDDDADNDGYLDGAEFDLNSDPADPYSMPTDTLLIDYGSDGLWKYDGAAFTKYGAWDPEDIEAWPWYKGMAVDYGAEGLFLYDLNKNGIFDDYDKLGSWDPENIEVFDDLMAVDYGTNGLYKYDGTAFTKIGAWDPEDFQAWEGGLGVDYGSHGLYSYNGTTFDQVGTANPEALVAWKDWLVMDYNTTHGLVMYDGVSTHPLGAWDPEDFEAWGDLLVIDYGSGVASSPPYKGLMTYDGENWDQIGTWDAEGLEAWGSLMAVDFGTNGGYVFDGTSYTELKPNNNRTDPDTYEPAGDTLFIDYGTDGLWTYDGTTLDRIDDDDPLCPVNAEDMEAVTFD